MVRPKQFFSPAARPRGRRQRTEQNPDNSLWKVTPPTHVGLRLADVKHFCSSPKYAHTDLINTTSASANGAMERASSLNWGRTQFPRLRLRGRPRLGFMSHLLASSFFGDFLPANRGRFFVLSLRWGRHLLKEFYWSGVALNRFIFTQHPDDHWRR